MNKEQYKRINEVCPSILRLFPELAEAYYESLLKIEDFSDWEFQCANRCAAELQSFFSYSFTNSDARSWGAKAFSMIGYRTKRGLDFWLAVLESTLNNKELLDAGK